jgi:hypothetical protein
MDLYQYNRKPGGPQVGAAVCKKRIKIPNGEDNIHFCANYTGYAPTGMNNNAKISLAFICPPW